MSVLGAQSAINTTKNYWLKSGTISSLTVGNLIVKNEATISSIQSDIAKIKEIDVNHISAGLVDAHIVDAENLSTINFYADIAFVDEATISSISTNAIELDGAYLTTFGGTELLLNGLPIATTNQLSSIQDWAVFPAVSTIQPLNSNIDIGQQNQRFRVGYFSSINALQANIQSTTLTANEFVSTLTAETEIVSSIFGNTATFSSIRADDGNFSTLQTLTANISTLQVSTFNGQPLSNFSASNWAQYPANSNVIIPPSYGLTIQNQSNALTIGNMSFVCFSSLGLALFNNKGIFTEDWAFYKAKQDVDFDDNNLDNCGDIDCKDVDGIDATFCNVNVGNSGTGQADVNIYGGNLVALDNALYVEGGCSLGNSLIHGVTLGALPVAGVNTQRVDVYPIGVDIFSPTFISLNSGAVANIATGGAFSLAVGGVANLAAGSYMEIDSGYLKMINNTPIILSANSGAGDPGGLNLNTYITGNSLQMDNQSFGCQDKIDGTNSWFVSSGSLHQYLETIPFPRIGQYYIKASFEIVKTAGSGNNTDAGLYYAPFSNPPISAFNQSIFGAPLYSMPSSQVLTINAPVVISTITGFTSTIGSTVTETISTFLSTGQTFSTFTSSFYSTITASGGLNLYFDGSQSQNSFTAQISRGTFLASYLGGYIPPV